MIFQKKCSLGSTSLLINVPWWRRRAAPERLMTDLAHTHSLSLSLSLTHIHYSVYSRLQVPWQVYITPPRYEANPLLASQLPAPRCADTVGHYFK